MPYPVELPLHSDTVTDLNMSNLVSPVNAEGFRSAIAKVRGTQCRTVKLKLTLTLVLTLTDTGGAFLTLMLGYRSLYIT